MARFDSSGSVRPADGGPVGVREPAGSGGRRLEPRKDSVRRRAWAHRMVLSPEHCGSRFCHHCGPRLGRQLRKRLVRTCEERFQGAALISLTVAPRGVEGSDTCRGFASPESAYWAVRNHRYVSRLMAYLGIRDWVCVLEWQGNGWPHWHLVVPNRYVDYRRLRHYWFEVWGVGQQVDVQRGRFRDGKHALQYITKYLTKAPRDEDGQPSDWPEWVLESTRRIRIVSSSRSVGALVASWDAKREDDAGQPETVRVESDEVELPDTDLDTVRVTECAKVRRSRCGRRTVVWHEYTDDLGEVRWEPVGVLPWHLSELVCVGEGESVLRAEVGASWSWPQPRIEVVEPESGRAWSRVVCEWGAVTYGDVCAMRRFAKWALEHCESTGVRYDVQQLAAELDGAWQAACA